MKFHKILFLLTLSVVFQLPVQSGFASIDSLRSSIDTTFHDKSTVDAIENLAEELIRKNDLTEAYQWLQTGLAMAEEIDYKDGRFNLSVSMGSQFLNRNYPDSAIHYAERALDLVSATEQRAKALNLMGNGHSRAGRSIVAIDLYKQVIALSDSMGNIDFSTGVLINLATAYTIQGNMDQGLQTFYEVLERAEETNNNEYIALATNNLGDKFTELENYEQAEYHLKRSRDISEKEDLQSNLVRVYLNLGNLYKNTERYQEARGEYEKALTMQRKAANIPGQVQVLYNIAMMHGAQDNLANAREYLQRALLKSREINFRQGIYYSVNGFGQLEMESGNVDRAIKWYQQGTDISDEIDNLSMKLPAYENMYQAHKQAGNTTEALNWLESYNKINDSLQSQEDDDLMAQYETKFNLKRSEQENQIIKIEQEQQEAQLKLQRWIIISAFTGITLLLIAGVVLIRTNRERKTANEELSKNNKKLKKLNQKVQDQNEELEHLNTIKTKLFAIIAHDLRGPLSSLQSLLYLLREHELSEQEMKDLTTNLEKDMIENASMMDNLLAWAQSQMSGLSIDKRTFNLKSCVQSVLDPFTLQAEKKKIDFDISIPEDASAWADYDMMKLVFRNLIANAIKFSETNSTVFINAVHQDNQMFLISVRDEGVGIAPEDQSKIFSSINFTSRGTNKEKGSGLGLNLCKEFIEEHGGKIWFESIPGTGTTFYFTLAAAVNEPVNV